MPGVSEMSNTLLENDNFRLATSWAPWDPRTSLADS